MTDYYEKMGAAELDIARTLDKYTTPDLKGTADYVLAKFVRKCLRAFAHAQDAIASDGGVETSIAAEPPYGEYDHEFKLWTKAHNHTQGIALCRDCGQELRWQRCNTTKGIKRMPFDTAIVVHADREFVTSHWDTCPDRYVVIAEEDETDVDDTPF